MEIVIQITDSETTVKSDTGDSSTMTDGSRGSSVTAEASTDINAGAAPTPPDASGAPSTHVVAHKPTGDVSQGDQSAGAAPSLH